VERANERQVLLVPPLIYGLSRRFKTKINYDMQDLKGFATAVETVRVHGRHHDRKS
jgi:hypothetical protein